MPAVDYQHFEILSSPQELTESFVNIGGIYNMLSWDELALFVKFTANDSENIQLKPFELLTEGGSDLYELPNASVGSTLVSIRPLIYELDTTSGLISLEVQARAIPFIRWKVKAGTVGASAGTIDSIWAYATARI